MCQRVLVFTALVALALLAVACGDSSPGDTAADDSATVADSPAEAIKGMLALAKAGNWSEYVATYYGERHKMDKPAEQVPLVAAKLKGVGSKLIQTLEACQDQEPTISADGNKATFPNGFTLHRDAGRWGFHL